MLRRRSEQGFTLVETLSALVVFSIVTLGLVPLLLSSLRGSDLSRSYTVGKNVAQETMERIRGLPYRREVSDPATGFPKKVDVLDLYFPRGFGPGFSNNVFTSTCASGSLEPHCPKSQSGNPDPALGSLSALPSGYNMTFTARFVTQCSAATTGSCVAPAANEEERYETVAVPATYYWQGDASGPELPCATAGGTPPCSSRPPPGSQMLELTTTVSWTQRGLARSYSLTSLIADRRFAGQRVDGAATIDYIVQIGTGFDVDDQASRLVATGGISETRIEARQVSRASHASEAMTFLLTDETSPFSEAVDASGASATAQAPPDVTLSPTNAGAIPNALVPFNHFDDAQEYAGGGSSVVGGDVANGIPAVQAGVAVDLPFAHGALSVSETGSPSGVLWVNNQATADPLNLKLDEGHMAWLSTGLTGRTRAKTTDVSDANRDVQTGAAGSFGVLRLFPTTFVATAETALIEIVGFSAETRCRSTTDATSATAGTSATWDATLRYWEEPPDGISNGGFSEVALSETDGGSSLAQLENTEGARTGQPVGNPLVYEDPDIPDDGTFPQLDTVPTISPEERGVVPEDIYLFPQAQTYAVADLTTSDPADTLTRTVTQPGFLIQADVGSAETRVEAEGRQTEASIDGAFSLRSSALNPDVPGSAVAVSIGSMRCRSLDVRP